MDANRPRRRIKRTINRQCIGKLKTQQTGGRRNTSVQAYSSPASQCFVWDVTQAGRTRVIIQIAEKHDSSRFLSYFQLSDVIRKLNDNNQTFTEYVLQNGQNTFWLKPNKQLTSHGDIRKFVGKFRIWRMINPTDVIKRCCLFVFQSKTSREIAVSLKTLFYFTP